MIGEGVHHGHGFSGRSSVRPRDAGLRRDIGLVVMIWASEGSIIGSGWLFGTLQAPAR
jgi:hypothetical protein